ncbi:MAG: flagella basal body P-ring formation protein FlgA [Bacillota bacterium]
MISSDQSLYRSGYNSDSEESSTDNEEKKDKEENEIIVRWGDKLKASISIGNINISTTVEARETGAKNEVIEVKNKESEKILEARIINSEEVEIQ